MKRLASWLIWLTTIGLVLASCAPPAPTPTPTPSPEASLEVVFSHSQYGFSIRYPRGWKETEPPGTEPAAQLAAPSGSPQVLVFIQSMKAGATAASHAEEFASQFQQSLAGYQQVSSQPLKVGDMAGHQISFTATPRNVTIKARVVALPVGRQAFVLLYSGTQEVFQEQERLLDAVAGSFKLEEPKALGYSREGALTLFDEGPVTLDPALARETRSSTYIVEIFSGLVTLDPDLRIRPALASSWQVQENNRTYVFRIRPGAKFHNGREVTAQDVKYSWERAADPALKSQTVLAYLGDIEGIKAKVEGRAKEISGVKVIDRLTLEVTIDAPKAYFLAKLAHTAASVVDRENVESGPDWTQRPNGTGPFKLKEWRKDELLVLERNEGFYDGPPKLTRVIFRLLGGLPMVMYERGQIDIAPVSGGDLERAQDPSDPLNKELVAGPTFHLSYLGFNAAKPPFNDANVRRAFTLALDRDRLVSTVLRDLVQPARGILPPGMPGFNDTLKGLPFDAAGAKAALAQSPYKDAAGLPPITFTTAGQGGSVGSLLEAIAEMWRVNLGVQVKFRQLEPETYFYRLRAEKDQLFDTGWVADYPDPENFLDVLFHTGNEDNFGEYSNPRLDSLLERARTEPEATRRLKLYQDAEQLIVDEAAAVPLFFGREYLLVKPHVKGYRITPLPVPILRFVSIEPR